MENFREDLKSFLKKPKQIEEFLPSRGYFWPPPGYTPSKSYLIWVTNVKFLKPVTLDVTSQSKYSPNQNNPG